MRDYQLSKVYDAEHYLPRKPFDNPDSAIRWAKKIALLEGKDVGFSINKYSSKYALCETENKIEVPGKSNWWCDEIVLLHELAHTSIHWGFAPHGIEFCQEFIRMVRLYCSDPSMHLKLKRKFDFYGVKYQKDQKFIQSLKRKIKRKNPKSILLSDGTTVFGKFIIDGNSVVDEYSKARYALDSVAYIGV